jgi:hypothetical protein
MGRFCSPDKGFAKQRLGPTKLLAEQWHGNERQRSWRAQRNDLAVAEAGGSLGPEAHTVLLEDVGSFYIFNSTSSLIFTLLSLG